MLPRPATPLDNPIALLAGALTSTSPALQLAPATDPPCAAPEADAPPDAGPCACPLHTEVGQSGRAALDDLFRRASQLSDVCACLLAVALLSLLVVLMR